MQPEFALPEHQNSLIEWDSIPDGVGILKMNDEGVIYYEPYPEVTNLPIIEQPTEPETPVEPEQPIPEMSVQEMQAQILLNTEYLVSRAELGLEGI